jgi:hypothetical protein
MSLDKSDKKNEFLNNSFDDSKLYPDVDNSKYFLFENEDSNIYGDSGEIVNIKCSRSKYNSPVKKNIKTELYNNN